MAALLPSVARRRQPVPPGQRQRGDPQRGTTNGPGDAAQLSPWFGLGVFFLYALATLAIGAASLVRRDA